ncbi:MAG: hypothetical protein KGN79_01740 [Acidobacteriota bacterium]|nr:hypothetical protein [Acidobacteriota bacterium]
MATAASVQQSRWVLHSRANWSARDDRKSFVVWLALMWIGLLWGFGVNLRKAASAVPPKPTVVWIHGGVFALWPVLLTLQILLVVGERVGWHRKMGWVSVGWACVMLVMGPWAAVASQSQVLYGPSYDPPYLALQLGDIFLFALFLGWAVLTRKNVAVHKRLMILCTLPLMNAGFGRVSEWFWPHTPHSAAVWFVWSFYGEVVIVAMMLILDWWRGNLLKQFVAGTLVLVGVEWVEALLYFWKPWQDVTAQWVATWARHAG